MRKLAKMLIWAAPLAACAVAGVVHAEQTGAEAVAKRRAAMNAAGSAFGGIRVAANVGGPFSPEQSAALKAAAEKLVGAFNTVKDPALWPEGSGSANETVSKALPEVWTDAAGFKAAMDTAVTAAAGVKTAVDGDDLAQMKAAAGKLQAACGACHTQYRGQ